MPGLPSLIPLYDPSRAPGTNAFYAPYHHYYRAPGGAGPSSPQGYAYPGVGVGGGPAPRQSRFVIRPGSGSGQGAGQGGAQGGRQGGGGARTPISQLPPTLTEEQLGRLDRLTREAIDERLRVLEGVSGAVYRCVEELTRMRSVLPPAGRPEGRRGAQSPSPSQGASTAGSSGSAGAGGSARAKDDVRAESSSEEERVASGSSATSESEPEVVDVDADVLRAGGES